MTKRPSFVSSPPFLEGILDGRFSSQVALRFSKGHDTSKQSDRPCSCVPFLPRNGRDSDEDIRHFLKAKLIDIKHSHFRMCYIPTDWPFLSDINELVRKSSRRFICATGIVRCASFDYGDPVDRLHSILDNEPVPCRMPEAQPSAELDASYMAVLIASCFSVF